MYASSRRVAGHESIEHRVASLDVAFVLMQHDLIYTLHELQGVFFDVFVVDARQEGCDEAKFIDNHN